MYKAFCQYPINRKPCGGEVKPTRNYADVYDESGLKVHGQRIRYWRCEKCHKRYPKMVTDSFISDPDTPQPLIGAYTQAISRG